ncbi:hypothetical protein CICLE_v10003279mg [Citrus x clementina]|uniref:Uncharacterized protein n=1 Tax=Citrus clementina TaxID=85681 RepID=V4V1R4_CITCL|nr:hypothetical protein CICLE_v10003279mg [Citrus x clementina]
METATLVAISISGLLVIGTLGGSRKKIAKKMIPRVETKRNV